MNDSLIIQSIMIMIWMIDYWDPIIVLNLDLSSSFITSS